MTHAETRICIIAPNGYHAITGKGKNPAGGAEIQLALLGKALAANGNSVTFVTSDERQPEKERVGGVSIVRASFRYLGGPARCFLPDSLSLVRKLRKIDADICLVKGPQSVLPALGAYRLLCRKKLVKIVAQALDYVPDDGGLNSRLYRLGRHFVDATVFQTSEQKRLAQRHLGLRGIVIPNIAHENRQTDCRPKEDIDVLWIGRCDPIKCPEIFISLAEKLPSLRFGMVLAGSNGSDMRRNLETRAAPLSNFRFLDPVPYAASTALYERTRLVACTSRSEGFPNTFLHAWQLGVPSVSLGIDPGGVIAKYGLGLCCRSLSEMPAAIRGFLANESEWLSASKRCMEYVRRFHARDRIVARFERLFAALTFKQPTTQ